MPNPAPLAARKKMQHAMKPKPADVSVEALDAAAEQPVPAGYQRLTFLEIERQFNALEALSQRALRSEAADDKVFTLLRRHYEPAHDVYQRLYNKTVEQYPAPKGSDETELPFAIAEARAKAITKLNERTYDIPAIPKHLILTPEDMPRRDLKGELGDRNKTAISFIKNRLGFLYPLPVAQPDEADGEEG